MANIKIVSATQARNNWFEILNWVNSNDESITITKNNVPIAKITGTKKYKLKKAVDVARSLRGFLKGKKTYFPYQDDKKVIEEERRYLKNVKLWKIR